MTSVISFVIWLAVAGIVFGGLLWSARIVTAQKKAWRAFAGKYGLTVIAGQKLLDPVALTGTLQDRKIVVYVESDEQARTRRDYTHIEVYLQNPPPAGFIISQTPLPEALVHLALPQSFTLPGATPASATTDDPEAMAAWLTPARVDALKSLLEMTEGTVQTMAMGNGEMAFLLWRGEDPLRDPRALNAIAQKLRSCTAALDQS